MERVLNAHDATLDVPGRSALLDVYRAMLTARIVDRYQADFVRRGDAFFHIPGEGHEPIAALGPHLKKEDWIAAHYRDKGLLLHRGVAPGAFLAASLCRSTAPGAGRQLPDIIGSRAHHVLSTPVPVGNHALHAVGVAAATVESEPDSDFIVVCMAGDGTSQQGEFLEALCEAIRRQLPVLFVIEDNGFAISTRTAGMTWLSTPAGPSPDFLGVPIRRVFGSDVIGAWSKLGAVVRDVRQTRRPAIVALEVDRLTSHTNADDQRLYRDAHDLTCVRERDPLRHFERDLASIVTEAELAVIRTATEALVSDEASRAVSAAEPVPVISAKASLPPSLTSRHSESPLESRGGVMTMVDAIRDVLRSRLECDPRVVLLGQDIEDPKGDVFGVTRGLSTRFPGRVVNAALSESTIVGTAIGRAIAGQRPIALIQFADFLPLAFNQIANELGTMYWRTAGEYSCPVVIMAPCGGYKPGMGPFHAQTFDGTAVHLPGIDVVMPSTPADACGLLNSALDSPRPTLFLYPKAALNITASPSPCDATRHRVPIGVSRMVRTGRDLTMVAWGNTVRLASRVAETLAEWSVTTDLFDLRSLSPWDEDGVVESVERTGRLLVVHEDNLSCGLGSEIAARVAERTANAPRILRVGRPDVPIPCHYGSQLTVLPGFRSTFAGAARLLGLEIEWEEERPRCEEGTFVVNAIGSGPADDKVFLSQLYVRPGDRVAAGDLIATVESSKCAVEICSPENGVVSAVMAREGDDVPVAGPLVVIRSESPHRAAPRITEPPAVPHLVTQPRTENTQTNGSSSRPPKGTVEVLAVRGVTGSRVVHHHELLRYHPTRTVEEIERLTGIQCRRWLAADEDQITLGVRAARLALEDTNLTPRDLDLVICSTVTPIHMTPSTACQVLARLGGSHAAAYDVNAACSGYLYALQIAHDFLQARPASRALILTCEAMSTRTDVRDFDTAFLFGDAATATMLSSTKGGGPLLHRPVLASKPESGESLLVPLSPGDGFLRMKGGRVFAEAVRAMATVMEDACRDSGFDTQGLDRIVPHQANGRILSALETRIRRPVVRHFDQVGNTSSSSIPLALEAHLASGVRDRRIGLCAFGGGFTAGAAVLESLNADTTTRKD